MKNYTDIIFVLDRSGSMVDTKDDTIGGINNFIKDQQEMDKPARLTLIQFNQDYEVIYEGIHIKEVPKMTARSYVPRGGTALLEAVGRTIDQTGDRLKRLSLDRRPSQVIFVIITDGMENSSPPLYTKQKIKDMIEHQESKYSWNFVFLGANQDAFAEASGFGGTAVMRNAINYNATSRGTHQVYQVLSNNMKSYRSAGSSRVGAQGFFNGSVHVDDITGETEDPITSNSTSE